MRLCTPIGFDLTLENLTRIHAAHVALFLEQPCTLLCHVSQAMAARQIEQSHRLALAAPPMEVLAQQGGDTDDWALIGATGWTLVQSP